MISPERKSAIRRLKIISGQIDGLIRLLEEEQSCENIFPQIKAVKNAFTAFSSEVTKEMMKQCIPNLSESETKKLTSLLDHFSKL